MSNEKNSGSELQKLDSSPSAPSSTASVDLREWVKLETQLLRECIPGPLMSVEAMQIIQDLLVEIAEEIGVTRFHEVVVQAIQTCDRRPTVATLRKLAGLNGRLDIQQERLVEAWDLVSRILTKHIGRDGQGNVVLRSFMQSDGEGHREIPVPEIPSGVKETVRMMGGWSALVESWPTYAGQRWQQFSQLYRGETGTALVVK